MQRLDITLPLYHPHDNWAQCIADAIRELKVFLSDKNCELHLYITNDGYPVEFYKKESLELINQAAGGNFHFLHYEKNGGKGFCLRHMISRTEGDFVIYTDGDFPFGWQSVANAFELLRNGNDVVMGKRGTDYNNALCSHRKILSKGIRFLNKLLLGLPEECLDTQAGLKGFNRKGKEIFLKTTVNTFIFDTEFILLAWKNNLQITVFPIQIRKGLQLSRMGYNIMLRELMNFLKILWKIRIKKHF